MNNKRDISMIALLFFITRAFFNTYNFNNIFSFLLINILILISIYLLKKIKVNILKYKIIKYIYLIIISIIFIIMLKIASNFINNNYFKYSNYFVIILTLLITSYFLGRDDIKTISSISEIFLIIFIITSLIICIGLISLININNFNGYFKLDITSFNYIPLLIVFIILYLRGNNIIIGYSLGTLSILIDNILLVGCLGNKLLLKYKFPGISILKSLNLFNFINHVDKFFSIIYLFEYTITLALIFFIIKNLIKKRAN